MINPIHKTHDIILYIVELAYFNLPYLQLPITML